MHSVTLNQLQSFEAQARQQGRPRRYLELLSPLHALWHARAPRRVGFLLFHWHVIEHFSAVGLTQELGVHADTVGDFSAGGRFAAADWVESMRGVEDSTNLSELVMYSRAIEGWHNESHMVIGEVTGLDMMDARANVFFAEFWNLHFFINASFEEQARAYATAAHPQLQGMAAIVAHIESSHPATISRI